MTLQDLIDFAALNEIPADTPIMLHDFLNEFHEAHVLDRDDLIAGEPLEAAWPEGNPIVLSHRQI